MIQDIPIGSLLIQSEDSTGEPLLLHLMLPTCIRQRHLAARSFVFLLDAQIGTGAAAFMAIRVLLDHGVPQENIIFVTFIVAAAGGVRVLRRAFPGVRIVCGALDPVLRESWALWDTLAQSQGQNEEKDNFGMGTPTAKTRDEAESEGRKVWVVEPGIGHIGECLWLFEPFVKPPGIEVAIFQAIDTTCSISKDCMHHDIPFGKFAERRANMWAHPRD